MILREWVRNNDQMSYSLFAGDVTGLVIPDVLRSDATLNIGCLLSKPGGNPAKSPKYNW